MSAPVYLCLHLPEFPAQSAVRLRTELKDSAVAVLENDPQLERVCSLNAAARRTGLCAGMTRLQAEQLISTGLLRRSIQQELASKQAARECAGRFSPRIEDASVGTACIFVLDITGTARLFGTPEQLAGRLLREIAQLHFHASIAVSANFESSVLLARSRAGVTIVPNGLDNKFLAPLSVEVLPLTPEQSETLAMWGIQQLGELAALPEKALIARMGQAAKRLRQLAYGEADHLFLPGEATEELKEHMEFDSEVELTESLLFVLTSMLEQLMLRAEARALSVAGIVIELQLDDRSISSRTVHPTLPSLDAQMFLRLAHLDLIGHPPQAPVVAMTVTVELERPSRVQLGLFSPQLPEASRLDVTLARISALVGEGNVGSPRLEDTHRPDSFQMERLQPRSTEQTINRHPQLALRRLRPAEAIRMELKDGPCEVLYFRAERFLVTHKYGPWKSSGDWWNKEPKAEEFEIESWDVIAKRDEKAAPLFYFLIHDIQRGGGWWMAGLYD